MRGHLDPTPVRFCVLTGVFANAPTGYRRSPPISLRPKRSKMMISSKRFRNSGWKCARTASMTSRLASALSAPLRAVGSALGRPDRCQNDDISFEIDSAPLAIGQNTIIQNLQQHVEYIWMRFSTSSNSTTWIGAAAQPARSAPHLVIADIAGGAPGSDARSNVFP